MGQVGLSAGPRPSSLDGIRRLSRARVGQGAIARFELACELLQKDRLPGEIGTRPSELVARFERDARFVLLGERLAESVQLDLEAGLGRGGRRGGALHVDLRHRA